jgi:hypothetical protein
MDTLPRSIVDAFWNEKRNPFVRTMLARMGSIPQAFDPEKDQQRGIAQSEAEDEISFSARRSFLCSESEHYFERAARNNFALLVNRVFFTKSVHSETGEIVGVPIQNTRLASGCVALKDVLYVPVDTLHYQGVFLKRVDEEGQTPSRTLRTAEVKAGEWTAIRAFRRDRKRGRKAASRMNQRLKDVNQRY